MSRNHYDDRGGVLPLVWDGDSSESPPSNRGVLMVEVWRPDFNFWTLQKPEVRVRAVMELWVHRHITGWHRIKPNGDLEPLTTTDGARRWAELPGPRFWTGSVTLDGWEKP